MVEKIFDVLLALPHPLALNLRHVDHHHLATRAACKLVRRLGLSRSGTAVEKAGEGLTEATLLHTLMDNFVLLGIEQRGKLVDLTADTVAKEELFGAETVGRQHIGNLLFGNIEIKLGEQVAFGLLGETVAGIIGDAFDT